MTFAYQEEERLNVGARIAVSVALRHGVTETELRGPRRHPALVSARAELYRELRARGWSYTKIGVFVGRDHTTVLAAISGRRRRPAGTPLPLEHCPECGGFRVARIAQPEPEPTSTQCDAVVMDIGTAPSPWDGFRYAPHGAP